MARQDLFGQVCFGPGDADDKNRTFGVASVAPPAGKKLRIDNSHQPVDVACVPCRIEGDGSVIQLITLPEMFKGLVIAFEIIINFPKGEMQVNAVRRLQPLPLQYFLHDSNFAVIRIGLPGA